MSDETEHLRAIRFIYQHWTDLARELNAASVRNGLSSMIETAIDEEYTTATVYLFDDARSTRDVRYMQSYWHIGIDPETDEVSLLCDLDPNNEARPPEPAPGTSLSEHKFGFTGDQILAVCRRCMGELLAAVGPEQGMVYAAVLRAKSEGQARHHVLQ